MGSFVKDFRDFINQGNVVDMAVGVIIGGAFGKIVSSLVTDVIMPLIGAVTGGISFSDIKYELTPAVMENGKVIQEANTLNIGMFIDSIINFLIIALCIFTVIRLLQKSKEKFIHEEAPAEEAPAPSAEDLLTEIRDLLKAGEEDKQP
ncbi:large-conductance mechanosensitive channel protein MscL [Peptococcus niger]|uniref:Large-conductance mechanosensitive channel n=1 Tax=Peptococcus niger TaxID=2741 RepID=A0A1G7A1Z8_PEPNI|nr:large-conductance mechanosensitive channel protein MscL [Peptococcus niger]SDE08924.1 large conductance mechanosensitive channel [Peptococcus niger]